MTDPTPTLVERLRSIDHMNVEQCFLDSHMYSRAADEIARLAEELARTERNRDMWKGQCERQASELTQLRAKADVLAGALGALVGEELGGDSHDGWRSHDAYRPVITWHDRRVARQALQAWNGEAE